MKTKPFYSGQLKITFYSVTGSFTQREDVGAEAGQTTTTCRQHPGGLRKWLAGADWWGPATVTTRSPREPVTYLLKGKATRQRAPDYCSYMYIKIGGEYTKHKYKQKNMPPKKNQTKRFAGIFTHQQM